MTYKHFATQDLKDLLEHYKETLEEMHSSRSNQIVKKSIIDKIQKMEKELLSRE